jgi:DNA polymerase-3 subunit alpha
MYMGVKTDKPTALSADLKSSDYVHLHNHTHHSLLDGLTKIPDLINRVKSLDMKSVAITDHGTMSGVIEFYRAAEAEGIKPIIGMEAYVAARSRSDRDPAKDKARYHLTVLAMNNKGYQNLMLLASKANLEGMYYKPRIDHEIIEEYNEGLIILSGCASGELAEALRVDNYQEAKRVASWYKSVLGDRYYLEVQDHGHPDAPSRWAVQTKVNEQLLKLSKELNIPCVVTSDGHYIDHSDQDTHEILLCVGTGAFLSEEKRMSLKDFELHVTDPNDVISRWGKEYPEVIRNTKAIADRCQVDLEFGQILIPTFPVPEGETEESYLDKLVYRGLAVRYTDKTPKEVAELSPDDIRPLLSKEVIDRMEMEKEVLNRMGYNGYFLIVQDFINWGKSQGIIFGPGRGSAAGSIIAFSLNITDLDPLKYDLLFERFLNPDRISMPDIDIDIQDTRRDEVIQYCADKYGEARVANIVTFGRMAARAAVRDVARVLEVPYAESDRLAKLIPPPVQGRHIPLPQAIKENDDLRQEYEKNPTAKRVIDFAIRLEGTIRSHGVHAAGVVIAPDDIVKYTPLEMAQKGVVATQYPMGPVEDLGLLKMDFLGLSNLTIIKNALRIIDKVYGDDIDISKIPLDDKKTFELLSNGETTGVFQLESAGMKRYLKSLKPTVFEDIIAMVALYRPGPLTAGLTDKFIARKNGLEKMEFDHELMEPALKTTYGVLVYQEQVMQISKDMCGFTGGEADTLRKAVGKKIREMMVKIKPKIINGAVANGVDKSIAEKFWTDVEGFADYAFNKSHAACYGLIAYQTAYLKAHYPDAFMAALMTSDRDNIDRLAIEINECKHMGMDVLPPDVNEGFSEFAVVPDKKAIRFGMAAVKGVGEGAVEEVLRAREDGWFDSVEDFARRVSTGKFNKKAWESLIKAGGFDSIDDRSKLLFNLESIQSFASKLQKDALSGQVDLFGEASGDMVANAQSSIGMEEPSTSYTTKDYLVWERELLGLYISSHPLDPYEEYLNEKTIPISEITVEVDNHQVEVGGIISTVRVINTKSGSKMAFVGLEDKFGEIEIIIFPSNFEEVGNKLVQDKIVRINGKISCRDRDGGVGDPKIIASKISFISNDELESFVPGGDKPKIKKLKSKRSSGSEPAAANKPKAREMEVSEPAPLKKLYVHIKDPDNHESLVKLKQYCSKHPGLSDAILVLGDDKKSAIRLPFRVDAGQELVDLLVADLGQDNIVIK